MKQEKAVHNQAMCSKLSIALVGFLVLSCGSLDSPEVHPERLLIFVANGAGFYHMDAASIFKTGHVKGLIFEQFPTRLAMSTYAYGGSYDSKRAWSDFNYLKEGAGDSAAASTALASGVKTHRAFVGVSPDGQATRNLLEKTYRSYRSAGIVSNESFVNAGIAAFAVHNRSGNSYHEISNALINKSLATVVIGAGNPWFDDRWNKKLDHAVFGYLSQQDWQNLADGVAGNDLDRDGQGDPWDLVESKKDFERIAEGTEVPDRLFGIIQAQSSLNRNRPGNAFAAPYKVARNAQLPTLATLCLAALEVLDKNPRGFTLVVEAASIDFASHANQSGRMIEELLALEEAVQESLAWLATRDYLKTSLVVVLGDHETGHLSGQKGKHGPIQSHGKGEQPKLFWHSYEHTNSLVPIYAIGIGAKAFLSLPSRRDQQYGSFVDNTQVGKLFSELIQ